MSISDFLGFLKDITPLLSAFLGILGVFNVFKTTGGKLTKWGWSAIVVISATAVSSVITSKMDDRKNQQEKEKMQASFNAILMNVNRVNHPIKSVELAVWVILPDDNPEVVKLKKKVKEAAKYIPKARLQNLAKLKDSPLRSSSIDSDGTIINYDIKRNGSLWPDYKYPMLSGMLLTYHFNVCVKVKPMDPQDFKYIHGDFRHYDWCAYSYLPDAESNSLTYDVKLDKIVLFSHVKFKEGNTNDNGAFTSTDDLPGSQVFFIPPLKNASLMTSILKTEGASENQIKAEVESSSFYAKMNIASIILSFKPYRELSLSSLDIKRINSNGYDFYYMNIKK